jgi:hypothetical protein
MLFHATLPGGMASAVTVADGTVVLALASGQVVGYETPEHVNPDVGRRAGRRPTGPAVSYPWRLISTPTTFSAEPIRCST